MQVLHVEQFANQLLWIPQGFAIVEKACCSDASALHLRIRRNYMIGTKESAEACRFVKEMAANEGLDVARMEKVLAKMQTEEL